MDYKVTAVSAAAQVTIDYALMEFYPHAMLEVTKLHKEHKDAQAKRISAYAYQMQKLIYSAKHTESEALILGYSKDLKILENKIESVYEQTI